MPRLSQESSANSEKSFWTKVEHNIQKKVEPLIKIADNKYVRRDDSSPFAPVLDSLRPLLALFVSAFFSVLFYLHTPKETNDWLILSNIAVLVFLFAITFAAGSSLPKLRQRPRFFFYFGSFLLWWSVSYLGNFSQHFFRSINSSLSSNIGEFFSIISIIIGYLLIRPGRADLSG